MEPSDGPGSLDSFQLANETLRRDLLSEHTNMEVSCSDFLGTDQFGAKQPASEPPLLTQSERERQKTQDSLSILGDPDSLELSKTQVEEFYNRVFPESSEPSSISWQKDATSQDHKEAKSPKGTEQTETRCKMDTHEEKHSPDQEFSGPSQTGSSHPQPCAVSSIICDDDVQSFTEGETLHSENEPQDLLKVSADRKILSEEENKVDLQEPESSANALPPNRDPMIATGPEKKVDEKIGCTPAEGSMGPEISETKPVAVTEGERNCIDWTGQLIIISPNGTFNIPMVPIISEHLKMRNESKTELFRPTQSSFSLHFHWCHISITLVFFSCS